MVAFAKATAATEVGRSAPRAVLLEDPLDPAPLQFGQQEERREERVTDKNASRFESIKQAA